MTLHLVEGGGVDLLVIISYAFARSHATFSISITGAISPWQMSLDWDISRDDDDDKDQINANFW